MLFTNLEYFILLVSCLLIFYLPLFLRFQTWVLILGSVVFYSFESPKLLILLILSTIFSCGTAYLVTIKASKDTKFFVTIGVLVNLLILGFFKYGGLIGKTLFDPSQSAYQFLISIPLPIGISFYTFQGISMIVDANKYKNDDSSLVKFFKNRIFYKIFFPQLIAGPINKAHEFLPQVKTKKFSEIDWEYCIGCLVVGYFLKMFVADNLKDYTVYMKETIYNYSSITMIIMMIGYSAQIFADFAGYSLIALGSAGLFGYRLKENFNFPYSSSSFSEFWKKWHISLSSFLKEYLYIPLGGNKYSNLRTYFNLFIVMALGGLWHGAAWAYLAWGVFHGILLVVERILIDLKIIQERKTFFRKIITFSLVTIGWVFFQIQDFNHSLSFFKTIYYHWSYPLYYNLILNITVFGSFVFLYHFWNHYRVKLNFINNIHSKCFFWAVLIFLILTNKGTNKEFIYFQF